MLQQVFEELVEDASRGDKRQQLAQARRLYEQLTGEILLDDPSFERRIAAFLEWYVLDAAEAHGTPPIVRFVHGRAAPSSPQKLAALAAWRASRLSLLELRRMHVHEAHVLDLLTGGKHRIEAAHLLLGCARGCVVLGRMVQWAGRNVLSDGLLYLPQQASKEIRLAAKKMRRAGGTPREQLDLLLRLAFFANRCERYRHVDPRALFRDCAERR